MALFILAMADATGTNAVQNSVLRAYKGLSTTILFSAVRGIHVYNYVPCKGEYFYGYSDFLIIVVI